MHCPLPTKKEKRDRADGSTCSIFNNNGGGVVWGTKRVEIGYLCVRAAIRFRKGAERSMQANHLDIPGVPSGFAPRIPPPPCRCCSLLFPSSLPLLRLSSRPAVFLDERATAETRESRVPVAEDLPGHVSVARSDLSPPSPPPFVDRYRRRKRRLKNRTGS